MWKFPCSGRSNVSRSRQEPTHGKAAPYSSAALIPHQCDAFRRIEDEGHPRDGACSPELVGLVYLSPPNTEAASEGGERSSPPQRLAHCFFQGRQRLERTRPLPLLRYIHRTGIFGQSASVGSLGQRCCPGCLPTTLPPTTQNHGRANETHQKCKKLAKYQCHCDGKNQRGKCSHPGQWRRGWRTGGDRRWGKRHRRSRA